MTSSPTTCTNSYCRDGWVERGDNESGGAPAMPCQVCSRPDPLPSTHPRAAQIAREFHEVYEALAPYVGYRTREASAVPWEDVPSDNKRLMEATVTTLLNRGVIR